MLRLIHDVEKTSGEMASREEWQKKETYRLFVFPGGEPGNSRIQYQGVPDTCPLTTLKDAEQPLFGGSWFSWRELHK